MYYIYESVELCGVLFLLRSKIQKFINVLFYLLLKKVFDWMYGIDFIEYFIVLYGRLS